MIELEELVAPFDHEPGDWDDVLRRARRGRRPRPRLVLGAAVAAAALVTALPLLTLGARAERGIRFRLHRPPTFEVVALRRAVELVGPDGRVLARAKLG
jgi:hypothetical protein